MKKIVSIALALIMSTSVFCACTSEGGGKEVETQQNVQELPSYAGQKISDYDANGDFIFTSSENRKVYPYESGYIVFTFTGDAVSKISRVLEFESEDAAEEYLTSTARAQVENGEIPTTMRQNGVYVIVNVGFDAEESSIGSYYSKVKADIISEFEGEEQ